MKSIPKSVQFLPSNILSIHLLDTLNKFFKSSVVAPKLINSGINNTFSFVNLAAGLSSYLFNKLWDLACCVLYKGVHHSKLDASQSAVSPFLWFTCGRLSGFGIKANAIYLACASAVYAEIDPDIVKAWYEIAVTGLPLLEDNGLPMEHPMTFRTWLVNNHSATVEGKIREIKAAQYSIVQYSKGNAMRKCIVPEQYVCEIPL